MLDKLEYINTGALSSICLVWLFSEKDIGSNCACFYSHIENKFFTRCSRAELQMGIKIEPFIKKCMYNNNIVLLLWITYRKKLQNRIRSCAGLMLSG